jgi:hypothetical protein
MRGQRQTVLEGPRRSNRHGYCLAALEWLKTLRRATVILIAPNNPYRPQHFPGDQVHARAPRANEGPIRPGAPLSKKLYRFLTRAQVGLAQGGVLPLSSAVPPLELS